MSPEATLITVMIILVVIGMIISYFTSLSKNQKEQNSILRQIRDKHE
jgi:preprotein translocase subunit YajC